MSYQRRVIREIPNSFRLRLRLRIARMVIPNGWLVCKDPHGFYVTTGCSNSFMNMLADHFSWELTDIANEVAKKGSHDHH